MSDHYYMIFMATAGMLAEPTKFVHTFCDDINLTPLVTYLIIQSLLLVTYQNFGFTD